MYEPRTYRCQIQDKELISFSVVVRETDLYIRALTNLRGLALKLVAGYRDTMERYIEQHPAFLTSLKPLPVDENAPPILQAMFVAATRTGTGPMASVAGAIAEFVGAELASSSTEIIVENGGDIYLKSQKNRLIGIYAGKSLLSNKIGLEINASDTPLGICTSSGMVGHSLSYGKADAVTVVSKSTPLADAAATAIGNVIKQPSDIPNGIEMAKRTDGLKGVVIITGDSLGLWGEIKLHQFSMV
ncbi:MAG: UPF0280 family protein [Dehalococcoidales bacterium]|nr:UPF0280 family protein [Dehalococcoidales bacterium]